MESSVTRRPGRKSQRMANVTATLPVSLLDRIDELIDNGKVPSRSQLMREALEYYLKEMKDGTA